MFSDSELSHKHSTVHIHTHAADVCIVYVVQIYLYLTSVLVYTRGQHGYFDQSEAMQPHQSWPVLNLSYADPCSWYLKICHINM